MYTRHLRKVDAGHQHLGHCVEGAKLWFGQHGLDWRDFVINGIPATTMEATGDALAIELARTAREEAANG